MLKVESLDGNQLKSDFGWIQTFSGHRFELADPDPDSIVIEDIAHSLAHQCRFGGHCLYFYSVAEHCYLMWERASPPNKLAALMHDAPEAYLLDLPRAIKGRLNGYRDFEHQLATIIALKFGIEYPWPDEVHSLDNRILLDERAQNMARFRKGNFKATLPAGYSWCGAEEDGWPFHLEPLGLRLHYWTPKEAEAKFLEAFTQEMTK